MAGHVVTFGLRIILTQVENIEPLMITGIKSIRWVYPKSIARDAADVAEYLPITRYGKHQNITGVTSHILYEVIFSGKGRACVR